ncbi:MAG: hypothetical protein KDD46_06035 [Bdellovibrionales bacterium]|nr:hypothetical protein [Bdellovibrionales bacterium]
MMKNIKRQFGWILTLPALLVLSGCFGDNQRGLIVRNNQGTGTPQQDARQLGTNNRAARNTGPGLAASGIPGAQPVSPSAPSIPSEPAHRSTAGTDTSDIKFVVKAPMTPEALCQAQGALNRVWPTGEEFEKDGISTKCEAQIMAARYSNLTVGETQVDFRDYDAIHPQRINGFLVAGIKFEKANLWDKMTGNNNFQVKKAKSEDKETNKKEKQNRKESGIDYGKIKGYSKHIWKRLAELKNPDELDGPALRRLFYGLDSRDQKIANHETMAPNSVGVELPISEALNKDFYSVELTDAVKGNATASKDEDKRLDSSKQSSVKVGFAKGGDVEPIPLGDFGDDGSLQSLTGLDKEFNNQTLDGSSVVVYETNILHAQPISLAIGHYVEKQADRIFARGAQNGSFMVLIDGQKKLYQLDALSNRDTLLPSNLEVTIPGKTGACRTTNVVMAYIPRSDKENDKRRKEMMDQGMKEELSISDSLFFADASKGDKDQYVYQSLHQGVTTIFPVKVFDSKMDENSDFCTNHFFSDDVLKVSTQSGVKFEGAHEGDTYVQINDVRSDTDQVTIDFSIFGVDPKEFPEDLNLEKDGQEVEIEGKENINFDGANGWAAESKTDQASGYAIVDWTLSGPKSAILSDTAKDGWVDKIVIKPTRAGTHRWDGAKKIKKDKSAASSNVTASTP